MSATEQHVHAGERLLALVGSDLEVPLVGGERVRYANLDNAASAPALEQVADVVAELLPYYGSVHRGAGFASLVSTEAYIRAREIVRGFVGAREDDLVLFTRNTTDAFNLLAGALPAGTTALTFAGEHHANLLPWRRGDVRHLPIPASPAAALAALETELAGLGGGPALVSVTGASNVTGEIWPIEQIAQLAHRHGARVALDAAQLAAHRPIDVAAWDVDYVAFSGHKLYAPYGAGVLAGRADWLDQGRPYIAGGGAVRRVTVEEVEWTTGAARHEAGTPAALGAVAIAAAVRALDEVGWERVVAHEQELLERLLAGLDALDGVRTYELWERGHDRVGVVSFNVDGVDPALLAAALAAEHGIGVRDGAFCAHPLMDHFAAGSGDGHGGRLRDAVRASIGVGTSADDIDRLLSAVQRLARDGASWTYVARDGYVVPEPDPRPRPSLGGLLDGGPVAGGGSACRD
ncbi:aminotransferase class V-fold PLP-dependent enzyme [Conexibacter sp. JD483]|uniref:aminotransferase class V-fold PLP-dependent enzyme n=1 Tax=unclassified Conexibacter TaxID=2627773 RepID=UPI0027253C32|nr:MULTISPECIES: aminotransferase class V-fold PLP-dependent enzyme [unclassified Conexibacter]MDO8185661.1 aminotransferase class V-fold PLP-dependent enzyme [Conexibacter sp. CPCC 205706]MDO8198834.1 aminotransferase class V-fold PLP-dependent enzyme [Conexibacter sp. CPCC 205762]MDR9367816.1 aminotransferase class V-fold PLP-dependent enzyme [Conexibacter sp. JD483]